MSALVDRPAPLGLSANPTSHGSLRWRRRCVAVAAIAVTAIAGAVFNDAAAGAMVIAGGTIIVSGPPVPVGSNPSGVAFTADGATAYVTNDGSLSVIDTATKTATATIDVGGAASGVVVSPDGATVYVTNNIPANGEMPVTGEVSVIATASNTVTGTIPVGAQPSAVAVSPDGATAYVTNANDGTVSVIATALNTVSTTIHVSADPESVAITPDGAMAYIANREGGAVSVIATASNTVTTTIPIDGNPWRVAVSPDGTNAYVTYDGVSGNGVSVIGTASNTVNNTFPLGGEPKGVAVSPDGATAYVTDSSDNSVYAIETATDTLITTIAVGTGPQGVAFSPSGDRAYVTNSGDGTVSVLQENSPMVLMTLTRPAESVIAGTVVAFTAQGTVGSGETDSVSPVYTSNIASDQVSGSSVTFTAAGNHLITATLDGITATTPIMVTAGPVATVLVSQKAGPVSVGTPTTFAAAGIDAYGNPNSAGDQAALFSVSPRTGRCTGAVCMFTAPGSYTITATLGGITATAMINVTAGSVTTVLVSPRAGSVRVGTPITFSAAGMDAYGNPNRTGDRAAAFTVSPRTGHCTGAVCTFTAAGRYTITATEGKVRGSTTITATTITSTANLTANKTTQKVGVSSVVLTATVSVNRPGSTIGSVMFNIGGKAFAKAAVVGGKAMFKVPAGVPVGSYTFTAVFTSTQAGVSSSTSRPVIITVVK